MAKYWLMKSEPDEFSIEDLKKVKSEHWNGVRNYQARNFMRDEMKKGDKVLFYHSSCKVPGVYGLAEICKEAYPDHTSFDPSSNYYDPKSCAENPRWFMVDVKFVEKFKNPLTLTEMKELKSLSEMKVVQKGSRLSITPIKKKEFDLICKLARR